MVLTSSYRAANARMRAAIASSGTTLASVRLRVMWTIGLGRSDRLGVICAKRAANR
jgi:hypothetical protein